MAYMKCTYSKCFCDEKSLDDEDVVKINSKRYHPQCYCVSQDIKEIKRIFFTDINPNVVMAQLTRVINDIVFNRGITTEYLLFGVNYYVSNKITLNYPGGLYYVIQNKDVKNAFDSMKAKYIKKEIESKAVVDNGQQFEHKQIKPKGIGDLLC